VVTLAWKLIVTLALLAGSAYVATNAPTIQVETPPHMCPGGPC